MKLSVIIPVFNEEKTIVTALDRVRIIEIPGVEKEIIVVDDGSSDQTIINIKHYLSTIKSKNINFFRHGKNLGKGAAVRTGIRNATGDYVIIQDADLEYDPKYIGKLIEPILNGKTQIVYGTRLKRWPHLLKEEKTPRFLLHYFGNRLLSLLTSILYGQWITDMETGYKVFPRKLVEAMNLRAKGFAFEAEITAKILKKGYHILEIPIATSPRSYEEGKKLKTLRDGAIAFRTLLKYK